MAVDEKRVGKKEWYYYVEAHLICRTDSKTMRSILLCLGLTRHLVFEPTTLGCHHREPLSLSLMTDQKHSMFNIARIWTYGAFIFIYGMTNLVERRHDRYNIWNGAVNSDSYVQVSTLKRSFCKGKGGGA